MNYLLNAIFDKNRKFSIKLSRYDRHWLKTNIKKLFVVDWYRFTHKYGIKSWEDRFEAFEKMAFYFYFDEFAGEPEFRYAGKERAKLFYEINPLLEIVDVFFKKVA